MQEKKNYKYGINGKTYFQRPLVLGQLAQLQDCLSGFDIGDELTVRSILSVLGKEIPKAAAIVLIDPDIPLRNKDVAALAAELEFNLDVETAMQIVQDFFVCNPPEALLAKLSGAIDALRTGTAFIIGSKS